MKKPLLLALLLGAILFFQTKPLQAQSAIHMSVMANVDLIEGRFPGLDYTAMYGQDWGLRYSMLPLMAFTEKSSFQDTNNTVLLSHLEGEYQSPMVIATIDYQRYSSGHKGPFDFLTAYTGIGYNRVKTQLMIDRYQSNSSKLVVSEQTEELSAEITSFAFGLYGGESVIMVDGRLLYFLGKTEQSEFLNEAIEFKRWMLLFSLGIGF